MSNYRGIRASVHSGVCFAILISSLSFVSCQSLTGGAGGTVFTNGTNVTTSAVGGNNVPSPASTPSKPSAASTPTPTSAPSQPSIGSIASVVAAAVNEPYIAGNSVQYYCDCNVGANQSCVAGNDANSGTASSSPKRLLDTAMTWAVGGKGRTVALCQGGSFVQTAAPSRFGYVLQNISCPAGTICNEIREYTPAWGNVAKPLITNSAGPYYLFSTYQNGSSGGYRIMNLKLQGSWDTATKSNLGFFLYTGVGGVHDITIENLDMDSFNVGVQDATYTDNNIHFIANHVTNNAQWGYLGGSSNLTISYNSFINSGGDNEYDHALYFASHSPVVNVSIVGNFISGFSTASGNSTCMGDPLEAHPAVTNFTLSGNVVVEPANAAAGCWGVSINNITAQPEPIYFRNAIISNNIVVNGGNVGVAISSCPYCTVQNNLVIFQNNVGGVGIAAPANPARSGSTDDVETNVKVVNNTIYFDTQSANGMQGGISVGSEGTGHIVANNTVMYAGAGHGSNRINCFTYSLPLTAYSFLNNNNCYSNDPATQWMFDGQTTADLLPAWQSRASGFDTSSSYSNPNWPLMAPLVIPPLDETKTGAQIFAPFFTPVGAPLAGAGSSAYASVLDMLGNQRLNPPSIGAY